MRAVLEKPVSQDLILQWWQACGVLALQLPWERRKRWLGTISQAIRYFRLLHQCTLLAEQRLYSSLCRFGLSQARLELASLMGTGFISNAHLLPLQNLEKNLQEALDIDHA